MQNILVFCVDQMRADFTGAAGRFPVSTPNLDRLAAEGVTFERSYCSNPICMPARLSMFTGLMPRDHGCRINAQQANPMVPLLPQILQDAGYFCHASGKLHLTPWVSKADPSQADYFPEDLQFWQQGIHQQFPDDYAGFSATDFVVGHSSYAHGEYITWLCDQGGDPKLLERKHAIKTDGPERYAMAMPVKHHYNRFIADKTIAAMQQARANQQPAFLWCSFPDPHLPVAPPEHYYDMYTPEDMPAPHRRDHPEHELADLPPFFQQLANGSLKSNENTSTKLDSAKVMAGTCGMVTHIDDEVGRVLNALEEQGGLDDTLIIFLSDHGDMMGDHGFFWKGLYTYDGCVRVPTIIRPPNSCSTSPRGTTSSALISQIDLLPSLLEYAQAKHPGDEWRDRETPFPRGSLVPINTYPGHSWWQQVSSNTSNPKPRDAVVIENDNIALGLQARCLLTDRYRLTIYPNTGNNSGGDGELYDLVNDPHECYNLWYQAEHRELRYQLQARLLSEYTMTTPFHPVPVWNA